MKYKVLPAGRQGLSIKSIMWLVFTIYACFSILNTEKANAAGVSLKVYPTLIKIRSAFATDVNSPLTIENLSTDSVNLRLNLKLFKGSENGEIIYLKDQDNHSDILNNVQIFDGINEIKTLSLGPKQKKDLQIKIKIPENQSDTEAKPAMSDYYFSIIFITDSNLNQVQDDKNTTQSSFSNIHEGIATNILLSTGAATKALAQIEEFSSASSIQSGPVSFNVKIKNTGSKYINPHGQITIKNMFGQLIGKINIPAQNILANSSRYLESGVNSLPRSDVDLRRDEAGQESAIPKAVWPEKFLLGPYTAELSIDPSPTNPEIRKTIHFTALPLRLIAGIIISLIISLVIYRRVKQKM